MKCYVLVCMLVDTKNESENSRVSVDSEYSWVESGL